MNMISNGVGVSGCVTELVWQNGRRIVRKTCPPGYEHRLMSQGCVQEDFYEQVELPGGVAVPEVLRNAHGVLEMEYFPLPGYIQYSETASVEELKRAFNMILQFVLKNAMSGRTLVDVSDIAANVFAKVEGLEALRPVRPMVRQLANQSISFDTLGTRCHGDLTLSNVLFGPSYIVLLDFLDQKYRSPIFDFIKLRQDALHHWTSLTCKESHDRMKVVMLDGYLLRTLEQFPYGAYPEFRALEFLNYVRILPYVMGGPLFAYVMEIAETLWRDI